jgi:hypothetical protein
MDDKLADIDSELNVYLTAIWSHGSTTWADSSCGSGRPGGQMITGETHPEVIDFLCRSGLEGKSLKQAADEWETFYPGTVRLDAPAKPPRRRGPDGRPV